MPHRLIGKAHRGGSRAAGLGNSDGLLGQHREPARRQFLLPNLFRRARFLIFLVAVQELERLAGAAAGGKANDVMAEERQILATMLELEHLRATGLLGAE